MNFFPYSIVQLLVIFCSLRHFELDANDVPDSLERGMCSTYCYMVLIQRKTWKRILWILPFLWGILLLYQASLLLMYLFSMPLAEAAALAGYQRYEKTIVLFLVGYFTIFLLKGWPVSSRRLGMATAFYPNHRTSAQYLNIKSKFEGIKNGIWKFCIVVGIDDIPIMAAGFFIAFNS